MSKQQAGRGGVVDELLHLVLRAHSSHIPAKSALAAVVEPPPPPQSAATLPLEHEIPSAHCERGRTQTAIYLRYLGRFSGTGVRRARGLHVGRIYRWLRRFNGIIIVPSFIKCDRLVSASFVEPCALGSWHTVHWSGTQIGQMFLTLRMMATSSSPDVWRVALAGWPALFADVDLCISRIRAWIFLFPTSISTPTLFPLKVD